MTANAALDVLRRERVRPEVPVASDPPMSTSRATSSPVTSLATSLVRDLVAQLLNELPEAHRRTVQLVDLDGCSTEAAALLGCAEGTVNYRRARAFQALAARWTRDGDRRDPRRLG